MTFSENIIMKVGLDTCIIRKVDNDQILDSLKYLSSEKQTLLGTTYPYGMSPATSVQNIHFFKQP